MQSVIGACLIDSQYPPACQSESPAVFGIGGQVPKIPLSSRPWTARDWAIAAFFLEGTGGRHAAVTLH
jgi:hypothetical protein